METVPHNFIITILYTILIIKNIISVSFYICYPINNIERADSQLHMLIKYSHFYSVTLFGVELPHPLQMRIQLRKLHLLIQHFMILQLRHTTFITQRLKEIHSGRETGLIDTGPFEDNTFTFWWSN